MATVYKVEIVSHWVNYSEKDLERVLQEALEKDKFSNTVRVKVEKQ